MSASDQRILTAEQVERVYQVTDTFSLLRDFIVVPLMGDDKGIEMVLPDGKVYIKPRYGAGFEEWFKGLPERISRLPLHLTRRAPSGW